MNCPSGFQQGPLGDRCFNFEADAYESWLDAFCNSVYHGHELAIEKNLLDFVGVNEVFGKMFQFVFRRIMPKAQSFDVSVTKNFFETV